MMESLWKVLVSIGGRYLVFAGLLYGVFYVWRGHPWKRLKIQVKEPKKGIVIMEFLYSALTISIFSVVIWWLVYSPFHKHTRVYDRKEEFGMLWFWASIVISIFVHDTYFYWTHRLMHWKPIFRYAHHVHHRSHNPTPLAAYSFHPLETIVELGVVPLIVFTMPIHPSALIIFGIYMIVMNVTGHLGYELYTKKFMQSRWLKYFHNTSTHHNMHHKYSHCNYGLYFNFWDRIMGTNHPKYEETYLAIYDREAERGNAADVTPRAGAARIVHLKVAEGKE
ncbi:MAG TPA: sterol desaturase family protein [Puia sp.]|uniref:sterol desaturase family protein n=1 Tax=Puia sp. TaxID=2045100 RepID=UPI002D155ADA|nr:sterol desaturase family protein [Puia sp.]HVU94359.1 sterol desaturase family protein [Puia sp.]